MTMTPSTPSHTSSLSSMMTTLVGTWVWDLVFLLRIHSCHPFYYDVILLVVEKISGTSSHQCPFSSWHMDLTSLTPFPFLMMPSKYSLFVASSCFMWKPYLPSAFQLLGYFLDFHAFNAVNFWVQEGNLCRGTNFLLTDMLQCRHGI